jgi:hypothetical protein
MAMDPIARQNNYMRKFLENVYGISEEHQYECLLELSQLPQRLPETVPYDTSSRYAKTAEKLASLSAATETTLDLKITGVYGGVSKDLLATGEVVSSSRVGGFKKFSS